jgi:hypothetical protein
MILQNGDFRLRLFPGDAPLPSAEVAYVVLNIAVNDLRQAVDIARERGAIIENPLVRDFALGQYVEIRDPYGHRIHLLRLAGAGDAESDSPEVFNVGVTGADLTAAETFYTRLGFEPLTRKYLPETLPLTQSGAAMIVLHGGANSAAVEGQRNFRVVLKDKDEDGTNRVLHDPSGNEVRLFSGR